MKQVIVIRSDLDMSNGKLAGQAAHAAVKAAANTPRDLTSKWHDKHKQTKIVLEVESEEAIRNLAADAATEDIPHAVIEDAGHTELDPGTVTTIGIGPADIDRIDSITGHLPLYQ